MKQFRIRPKARRDLIDTFRNLHEILGVAKAEQFQANALQTFLDLAQMPNVGAPRMVEFDPMRDFRMWRIRGFEEYLVFYSVETGLVNIDRVIHAKRDFKRHAP